MDGAVIAAEAASYAVYAAADAAAAEAEVAAHWVKLYEIEIGGLNEPAA